MSVELRNLISMLRVQKTLQEELLNLSYEKRQVIIEGDIERLSEIVGREMRLLAKINSNEKHRIAAMDDFAVQCGIDAENLTLSDVIETGDGKEKIELTALQKDLGTLMNTQMEINALNQQLLGYQMEYTDAMLNVLVGRSDPLNNFYGDDGKADGEQRQSAGIFDRQV